MAGTSEDVHWFEVVYTIRISNLRLRPPLPLASPLPLLLLPSLSSLSGPEARVPHTPFLLARVRWSDLYSKVAEGDKQIICTYVVLAVEHRPLDVTEQHGRVLEAEPAEVAVVAPRGRLETLHGQLSK